MPTSQDAINAITRVNDINFDKFTSNLVKNVYETIVKASMDQLNSYAKLVRDVSEPLATYQSNLLGDNNARETKARDYIRTVYGLPNPANTTDKYSFDDDKKEAILKDLDGVNYTPSGSTTAKKINDAGVITVNGTVNDISQTDLVGFVVAKFNSETEKSYELIKTILKIGMQKVVIKDGFIATKLTFKVDYNENVSKTASDVSTKANSYGGSLGGSFLNFGGSAYYNDVSYKVNIVNEKSSAALNISADIIGEVKLSFYTETFPPAQL